jgi:hypothetical protein
MNHVEIKNEQESALQTLIGSLRVPRLMRERFALLLDADLRDSE